jgi:putative NIF3 family GTP cyclohydrolase 1 type 2
VNKLSVALLCALASTLHAQSAPPMKSMTAREAIAAIEKANGAVLPTDTVDTIKAGDPNTVVTGVVSTFMDTWAVLQAAVAHGDNLIVTHEPTFYNHRDERTGWAASDPVVQAKLHYIEDHHLVVWRFHDGWHRHVPDGILTGVVARLGWGAYVVAASADSPMANSRFILPAQTVGELAQTVATKLHSPVVRVVGDPQLRVTRVGLAPGAGGLESQVHALEGADVEALVVGESAEWEATEYVRDASALGLHKALIVAGHEPSEEPGMEYCAQWLRGVLPGMRVDWIPAASPYALVIAPAR